MDVEPEVVTRWVLVVGVTAIIRGVTELACEVTSGAMLVGRTAAVGVDDIPTKIFVHFHDALTNIIIVEMLVVV